MNKCVVCGNNAHRFTCSSKCAGLLATSTKYRNNLKRSFSSDGKIKDMYKMIFIIAKVFGFKKLNMLQFYGGGVFNDIIKEYYQDITSILIDSDKKLWPVMRTLENQDNVYCGDYLSYSQKRSSRFNDIDVYYFDFCGWFGNKQKEIIDETSKRIGFAQTIYKNKITLLFITISRNRENYDKTSSVWVKELSMNKIISDYLLDKHYGGDRHVFEIYVQNQIGFGLNLYKNEYQHDKWKMETYGYML